MSDCDDIESASHLADLPRLNRVTGQINGVKKMIEDRRYCPDILTQLRAIRAALRGLEASILERHLGHCLTEGLSSRDPQEIQKKIAELKDILRKYDE